MITTQTQIVMAPHVNGTHRLFGGQLMAWIDVTAAVEARRHAGTQVTTVTIDHLEFLAPVMLDEVVRLDARVTWTGRTSLEVRVDTYVEPLVGEHRLVNRAYLVFVALNWEGKPTEVSMYEPQTPEERLEWEAAVERRAQRMNRKNEIK